VSRNLDPKGVAQYFLDTSYGFKWGASEVTRLASSDKQGWIVVEVVGKDLDSGARKSVAQVLITKTGKMRISVGKATVYAGETTEVKKRGVNL